MKTIAELAEIVLDRCGTVDSLGRPTQPFRIVGETWLVRVSEKLGKTAVLKEPERLIRAALLRAAAATGDVELQTGLMQAALDAETITGLRKYLEAGRTERHREYTFQTVDVDTPENRWLLSFLTDGREGGAL